MRLVRDGLLIAMMEGGSEEGTRINEKCQQFFRA